MAHQAPVLVIENVHEVDDAGGRHYETVLTGRQIIDMIQDDLLRLEGNIRPDWRTNKMSAKTKRKVSNWSHSLLEGNGVIGNLSIRIDPDPAKTDYEVTDDDNLELYLGYFDTAVDSQSRITAIQMASDNIATMNPSAVHLFDRRFAVRIWVADQRTASRVGRSFNTDGDKVNESAAKSAYSEEFTTDDLANRLVHSSQHLTFNNVEVLKNSVSASSAKLFAFNTLSRALEDHWTDVPHTAAARDEQVKFLVDFWGKLVEVRPEFGRVSIDERKKLRGNSVVGSALSIHGVIAIAAELWRTEERDLACLERLAEPAKAGNGDLVDYFAYRNPDWQAMGVLVSSVTASGTPRLTIRSSFQTRKAVADALLSKVGLA
ncbi:DNA sulfur modification protein DndB [Salana multivorans]